MDYIEDDFTDALIDAVCGKLPSTWYTLIGENFDPDEETIVKEADVRNINYQALRVLGITKFNRRVMVILSEIIGKS